MAEQSTTSLPEAGPTPGRLVTIATFHSPYEGHLALGALRAADIPAWLLGSSHAGVAPHLSIAIGARLATREADVERAKAILREAEGADGWELCPQCGSSRIRRRKRLWVVLALFALLGLTSPYAPHNARRCCYDCGHEWVCPPAS